MKNQPVIAYDSTPDAEIGSVRPRVAHFVFPFLPTTCNWIYGQLTNMRSFRPVVVTDDVVNRAAFPFDPVHCYHDVGAIRRGLLCLWKRRLRGGREPFYEWALRRERAVAMHCHFGDCGARMIAVKLATGLPMVTTFYGADVSQLPRDPRWQESYRRLFEVGELFLAEGNAMRQALVALGCPPEKVRLQRLGVDLSALPFELRRPDPQGFVRILVAGTFREKKGIPDALRAVQELHRRGRRLQVTLIGDGAGKRGDDAEKRTILELVERLRGVVNWVGFVPHERFRSALLAHDILLSPSRTAADGDSEGGAPVSLIEAQATGMPVVSTLHADIPEIVPDGRAGLLSAEGDVEALVSNLDQLLQDPTRWEELGKAGRAHVEEHHDVRKQAQKLESVYLELMQRPAGNGAAA